MGEEDTVTVGQDLVKLELGGAPEGGKKEAAPEQPKEPAAEKPKEPAAEKPKEPAPEPEKPKETQASKPAAPEKPKESPKSQPAPDTKPAFGSREERRVRPSPYTLHFISDFAFPLFLPQFLVLMSCVTSR